MPPQEAPRVHLVLVPALCVNRQLYMLIYSSGHSIELACIPTEAKPTNKTAGA
jgi:hypothetical protein